MTRALVAAALVLAFAASAAAQGAGPSLGDIARQAEAAKASIPKAKRTYTNADLGVDGLPPAPETPASDAGYMSASQNKPVSAEEMLKLSNEKAAADEKLNRPDEYWSGQAASIRLQVEKLSATMARLQGQANPNAAMQKRAAEQIADIQRQMERFKKRWAGLEAEARAAKINLTLLLPLPAFPE